MLGHYAAVASRSIRTTPFGTLVSVLTLGVGVAAGCFAARAYLNQFSQAIDLTLWPFLTSLLITLAIAWLAVAGQTLRAARTTPAEVLCHE